MLFLILGLLLGAVAVIFALQNVVPIGVTFLVWQIHGSLALVLILAVIIGIMISALVSIPEVFEKHREISDLRRQNKKLEDDANAMRAAVADLQGRLSALSETQNTVL